MSEQSQISDISFVKMKPVSPVVIKTVAAVSDMAAILFSSAFAYEVFLVGVPHAQQDVINITLLSSIIAFATFYIMNCYQDDVIFSMRPKAKLIVKAWIHVASILLLIDFALNVSFNHPIEWMSWAAAWFVGSLALLIVERSMLTIAMIKLAQRGYISQRSVIVGAGAMGERLADYIAREFDLRTRVIGFIDDRKSRVPAMVGGLPVLGNTKDLVALVREEQVDQVFVALPWSAEERLKSVLERLSMLPVHVRLAPELINFHFPARPITTIAGLPLVEIYRRPISGWSSFLKSAEDIALSSLLLVFSLPLFLVIALAIKLDSPGPIFFSQQRYGFNNRLFRVLKFRTMHHAMADLDCDIQTQRNDPRVTRVGRFLRRSSLDELPQLINVLIGDMSIVGPRPHAVATKAGGQLFEEAVNEYAARHKVKPGITGWAQVNGWRGETDTAEKLKRRVEHDLFYIENWSIGLDFWIITRTIFAVLHDPRAY
jgi:Undecaprenyl-phosphate glucose phosphotransferase